MKTINNVKDFIKENKAYIRGSAFINFILDNDKTIILLNVGAYKNKNDKVPYCEFWKEYDKNNKEDIKKYANDLLAILKVFNLNMRESEKDFYIIEK